MSLRSRRLKNRVLCRKVAYESMGKTFGKYFSVHDEQKNYKEGNTKNK